MVPLFVVLMIVVFIILDVVVRTVMEKIKERQEREKRAEVLETDLQLDYTDESETLERVEVDNPKARILAVDDETVVLDSFRKILVLEGYSVDTVETGKEAVGLARKNNYDFAFVDLKMPGMDGVEVTKAIKHYRPDIDVVIITGYASIDTAVETMKYGALDYVEKPFSEEELAEQVEKWVIEREDKIEKQRRANVHLVTPRSDKEESEDVFNVPAGVFISPEHVWVSIEMTGQVRIGLDDFSQKTIREIDEVVLPEKEKTVEKDDPLFSIKQNSHELTFPSPVSGEVIAVNHELQEHVDALKVEPYDAGWICSVDTSNLNEELQELTIGSDAVDWYEEEFEKFRETVQEISREKQQALEEASTNGKPRTEQPETRSERAWEAFAESFLKS